MSCHSTRIAPQTALARGSMMGMPTQELTTSRPKESPPFLWVVPTSFPSSVNQGLATPPTRSIRQSFLSLARWFPFFALLDQQISYSYSVLVDAVSAQTTVEKDGGIISNEP